MNASPTPVPLPRATNRVLVAVVVLLLALVVVLAANDFDSSPSAVQGSGTAAAETRHVAPFDSLDLAGSNNVVVRTGAERSVVVRGDDNLLPMVTTRVLAGRLVIGTTGSFATKAPMRVEVTVPSLRALTLSGSGVIHAGGTAKRLGVSLTGSGDIDAGALLAREVHATIDGSGRIVVAAGDSLDAAVHGSGVILYSGGPEHVAKNVTGSGAIVGG